MMPNQVITITNGMNVTNGGGGLLSPATQAYVSSEIAKAASIDTRANASDKWRSTYQSIADKIYDSIQSWRVSRRYFGSDASFYQSQNLPFKTNGEVVVVFSKRLESKNVGLAAFDSNNNRIVVNPAFADMLSAGRVVYLRGNTRVTMTLSDVILHELGHRTDGISLVQAQRNLPLWQNGKLDGSISAEMLESLHELLDGRIPRKGGHDSLYFVKEDGNLVSISETNINSLRQAMPGLISDASNIAILRDLNGQFYVVNETNGETTLITNTGAQFGRMAGSSLGNYLTRNDGTLAQIAASTVLGSMGQALGNVIAINGAASDLSKSFDAAFADFDQTLYNNLKSASVGALSAYTTMELGRAIGLTGFGAELFNAAAGSAVSPIYDKVIGNIVGGRTVFDGFNVNDVFGGAQGFGDLVGAGIASFFGAKLGSLVISPTTSAGAALASLGSAAGAYALSSAGSAAIGGLAAKIFGQLGQFANIIGPGIGAFVGFVLGALLGSLFGKKKPRIPTASAEVTLNFGAGEYQLGAVTVANKGNRELVTNMATIAADSLNGIIEQLGGDRDWKNVTAISPTQVYGHNGNQIRARFMSGSWQNFARADEAVDWGILSAVRQTKVSGGSLYQKRALSKSPANSVSALLGDLQVAYDYELYMHNRETINTMIRDNPTSELSAAWIVTLGRANELGLNKLQASDFYGGLKGFIQSINTSGFSAVFENYEFRDDDLYQLEGQFTSSSLPGAFDYFATFQDQALRDAGFNLYDWGTYGNDIVDAQWTTGGASGTFDGYGGDDIILGSGQLLGSAGYDWLRALQASVMDGGSEDDVLIGSYGNDRMLGGTGDDYISGGWGDDYFYDAARTWGGYGGDGNDTLVGNAGTDSLYGENGDDTFIVDQDGGSAWDTHEGQAGQDTLSFERFNVGVEASFLNLGGWSWNPQAKFIYGDSVSNIENLTGSQFDDYLSGDNSSNTVRGLGGNDTILGQDGDDVLEGGLGADYLMGRSGTDTASYENSDGGVIIDLAAGAALGGDASGDSFSEIENLRGSRHSDELTGNSGNNALTGLDGDDAFYWSSGYDVVNGGKGFDVFDASAATSALTVYSNGYAYAGGATSALTGVEGFIGTGYEDNISGTAADELFDGREYNDVFSGGEGADTYIYGRGYHWDTIHETVSGYNVISLEEGLNWRDVWIKGWGLNSDMTVDILPTGEWIRVVSNYQFTEDQTANYNKIKTVDIAGLSSVDVGGMLWAIGGQTTGADTLRGASNAGDIIFDYGGNDYIYASYTATSYEQFGNLVYAGDGDDHVYASGGDDQYIFEYGNGRDIVYDSGGADTVIMGPAVNADDVIYEVKVTGIDGYGGEIADLYIGLRDAANPNLQASQVANNIRIINGGTKFVDLNYGTEQFNSIEHVRVAGMEIDLSKADIAWRTSYTYNYGGGTHLYPVAIDLDGDGIELRSVEGSRISTVDADGALWRLGWLGQDDGFLALDRNSDGVIDRLSEISFVDDLDGAKTDLEGLAAYDANKDGAFDAKDARWVEFRIWQDGNQDGIGSKKELISLAEAGIVSISLKGQATGFTETDGIDNSILATTTIGWADPTRVGKGYDVALAIHHVRSDDGGRAIADDHAKAKGKNKAEDFEAKLYGIQALTDAEITAGKAKGKRDTSAEAGLLGRVETFLPGASKDTDGKLKFTEAENVHRKNRKDADEADLDAKKDKFAKDDWTLDGSTGKPVRLEAVKDDKSKPSADLNADDKAKFDKAVAHFEDEKKRKKKDEDDTTARDAVLPEKPTPTPIPTEAEFAKLKARDPFRLLTNDTDPETAKKLEEQKKREAAEAQSSVLGLTSASFSAASASEISNEAESAPLQVETAEARQAMRSKPGDYRSRGSAPMKALADISEGKELGYDVRIQAANARLIQALGRFGSPKSMMAHYRGLGSDAADTRPEWLTVHHQPSIHGFAALR